MKCSDAIHLMAGYVDQTLPEASMKAMKTHLQQCQDCHTEYVIWKESSVYFQEWKEPALPAVSNSETTIMVDRVMERISREDKWAFPITAHVFRIKPSVKKWMTSISVLCLLVFGVLLFGTVQNEQASVPDNNWREMRSTKVVMTLDQLRARPDVDAEEPDIRYKLIASIGDPLILRHAANATPQFNGGLVAGFLGIMITVVTMNWLSRA